MESRPTGPDDATQIHSGTRFLDAGDVRDGAGSRTWGRGRPVVVPLMATFWEAISRAYPRKIIPWRSSFPQAPCVRDENQFRRKEISDA
jgi:hypothetical protein